MHIYPRNARGREVTPRLRDSTCKMETSDIEKCKGGDGVLAHPRCLEEAVDSTGALRRQWYSTSLHGPSFTMIVIHPSKSIHNLYKSIQIHNNIFYKSIKMIAIFPIPYIFSFFLFCSLW